MSGSQLVPVGGPDNAAPGVGEEDARQFILRVKQTVERCLAQGMNKAQMFRAIREEGLEPGAAFAVYKELRHQNRGFFEEYYCMIDLKEQRQRFNRLVHAYRTGGDCDAELGARAPETVAPLIAMEETGVPDVNVDWPEPDQQQALHLQAWLSNGAGHQFAPAAWPQQAVLDWPEQVPNHGQQVADPVAPGVAWPHEQELKFCHLPAWEQLHNHQQPLADDSAFQGAAWPQQALHLPAAQQLHNREDTAADGGFRGLVWPQQEVMLQNEELLHDQQQQQPAANGGFRGLVWPQQEVMLQNGELLHDQQQQQPAADGGFRGLVWPQQEVMLQNGELLHDQQQQQPAADGGLLQGLTWPQQAVHFPAAQLHYHEQAVANGLPPLTSAAGLHNDAMMDPWHVSHSGQSFWQGQQAGSLEQWLWGASANPSLSSSLSRPPENQQY